MVETIPREYNNFLVLDKYSPAYDIRSSYYADNDLTLFHQVMIKYMYFLQSPKNIRTKIKFDKQLLVYRQLSSNFIDIYEIVLETTHVGTAILHCVHFAVFTMKVSQISFFESKFTSIL